MKRFITIAASVLLVACNSDYEAGVKANVDVYKLYNDLGLAQQASIAACFQTSKDPAYCAILAASTNTTQTLAGRPEPIRVAKTSGEIIESVMTVGLDRAVYIYGAKAVANAFKSSVEANKSTASAGIAAASKDPLVVNPVVIEVPVEPAPATP